MHLLSVVEDDRLVVAVEELAGLDLGKLHLAVLMEDLVVDGQNQTMLAWGRHRVEEASGLWSKMHQP